MRRPLVLATALLTVSLLTGPQAHAQSAVKSITLSPASTALTVLPNVAANRDLTLVNDGDTPYTVSLSVSPYRVQNEDYDPAFTRLPGTKDAAEWITLSQASVSLAAHQTAKVPYSIVAPRATAPGGYYAVIFAETGATGSGVSARNRVGNILYVTVDGQVTQAGSVAASDTPGFTFGTDATLGMRVTNNGGVHFQTDARFTIMGLTGGTVLDKTNTVYVLPQTTRHITESFSPAGFGGIYKVSRSATVAGEQKTLSDAWVVIVKPQIIPLVIFGLLTIIGFLLLLRRTRNHKK